MSAANDLLGGAERVRTRPRGFVDWRPQKDTLVLIEQVRAVLVEYAAYLPLTIRQIFYRLVGAHGFEKTERAYDRLSEHLSRARRARIIDMDAIRDSWSDSVVPVTWESAEQWLRATRTEAAELRMDRQVGQKSRLVVLCEAAGMVPQLGAAVDEFTIPVFSSGGFDSTTKRHEFALEVAQGDCPTEVLHIGDHDPSGAHMFLALAEDVAAFAAEYDGCVRFTRLAVTPGQVAEHSLPTAPPKSSDDRAFRGQTCQAEALAPDVLNQILRDAVEERINRAALKRVLRQEQAMRRELLRRLRVEP